MGLGSECEEVQIPRPRMKVSGRRYYSPSQGRFLGRDPIDEKGGLNLYGFVGNNPIDRWDFLGMMDDGMVWDPDLMTFVYRMPAFLVKPEPKLEVDIILEFRDSGMSSAQTSGASGIAPALDAKALATDWGKTQFEGLPQKLKESLCSGFLNSDADMQGKTYGKQATVDGVDFYREQSLGHATYSDGSTRDHSRNGPLLGQDSEGNWFQLDVQSNSVTPYTPFPPGTGYTVPSIFPAQGIRTDQIGSDGLGVQAWLTGVYSFHTHPAAPNVAAGVSGPDRSSTNLWRPPVIAQGSLHPNGYPAFGGAFDGGRKTFYGSNGNSDFEISFDDVRKALGCK